MHILGWILWALTVAGLGWWVYRGWRPSPLYADQFSKVALKVIAWVFLVIVGLAYFSAFNGSGIGLTTIYGGGALMLLFIVLSVVMASKEDEDERRARRLSGVPTEPRMMAAWAAATIVGIATFFAMLFVMFAVTMIVGMQAALQGVRGQWGSVTDPFSGPSASGPYAGLEYFFIAVCAVWVFLVFLAWALQRYRRWRAWKEYGQLVRGIGDRVKLSVEG